MNKSEVCGTCRFCRYDPEDDDWYCHQKKYQQETCTSAPVVN